MALELKRTRLRVAELDANIQLQKAALNNSYSLSPAPPTGSSSYVPPSQQPGSEFSAAAQESGRYAPLLLSSIPSELLPLPSQPNAPSVEGSIHAPSPGPSIIKYKGKQKASSPLLVDEFAFPMGHVGFQELRKSLLHLQGLL